MVGLTRKTLKFWSWVYRKTGWYFPIVRLVCWEDIESRLDELSPDYLQEVGVGVGTAVGIEVGMWEVRNKFYRVFKMKD